MTVLARLAEIADGAVLAVEVPGDGGPRALLVAMGPAGPVAYVNSCPHMDMPLDGGSGRVLRRRDHLFCRYHGAAFDVATGACVGGPCTGCSLERVPVEAADGAVRLSASPG